MPRRPAWTDEQLREALPECSAWSELRARLGVKGGGSCRALTNRIEALGLSASHLAKHVRAPSPAPQRPAELPFGAPAAEHLRDAALFYAAAWFTERGNVVSLPSQPARYDLLVETTQRVYRVQIKTSVRTTDRRDQICTVSLVRQSYRPSDADGPNYGKRASVRYLADEVDYFFVVIADGRRYLVPFEEVQGMSTISLGSPASPHERFRVGGPMPQWLRDS